ncbi:MAG TPA: tetratricopeptide repeat protein [Flavobacteriales bacterium]|nr:tetratricopeptide repeat protein [Flavobacteriales bacterium]HRE97253.1 tetratricopeptide repeat protein [Flavobacteriales bacterium]HRJ38469.1 tetratricopeptide repeat protein [Flavobacteriales bacterium]
MTARDHYNEGLRLLKASDYQGSLQELNKALEIAPDTAEFLSERAVVYFHLEKFDLSIIDLNRAQELEPFNGYRYSSRAYVKDRMGDIQGAIDDYRKAVEIDPEDAVSYNNLGIIEERQGYLERAKSNFNRADELAKKQENKESSPSEAYIMPVNRTASHQKESASASLEKQGKLAVIKSVFFSAEGFRDFLRFIKNGFKH